MASWWDLGEHSGFHGGELALFRITCPFCLERGNFRTVHHVEKKKSNDRKKLNFDTLQCGSCSGYVMTLWSASSSGGMHGLHDFKVLPWALQYDQFPEHWPEDIGRFWLQAKRNLTNENWDAAALMARSALQVALRRHNATGKTLKQEIDSLANQGLLPPIIKEWSHKVRELGNETAHPEPGQQATSPQDARDVVKFLDFLLEYLYTIPHEINEYRARKTNKQQ